MARKTEEEVVDSVDLGWGDAAPSDELEPVVDTDGSLGTVETGSTATETEAGDKPKRVQNLNGLTSSQYQQLRKSGQTPAKYVANVGREVATEMLAASQALDDGALSEAIVAKLNADEAEAGKLSAIWFVNVSDMAKRRIYNEARRAVGYTPPKAEKPAAPSAEAPAEAEAILE